MLPRSGIGAVAVLLAMPLSAGGQVTPGGFVEYDHITYVENPDTAKVNGRNQVILQTEIEARASDAVRVFGSVEVRHDQADPGRDRVFLDEAYMDLYVGPADVRLGQQVYAWGRADGFNPTDNLAPRDFTDPLDTEGEKLGLVSARATYYLGDWSVDAVLAPSFVPSALPAADSRWWPELPPRVANPAYPSVGPPSLDARYAFLDASRPDEGPASTQYAVRIAGSVGSWDLSLSWFDGYDDLPTLHRSLDPDPGAGLVQVTVEPRYHRRRTVGADAATAVGPVAVRGEAAYYLTADPDGVDAAIDDPYLHWVAGGDYTIRDLLGDRDLLVLLEWSREVPIPDRDPEYRVTDLNHVFRNALLSRLELGLGPFARLTLDAVLDLAGDGWYAGPAAEWTPADGLEIDARVDVFGGAADSFFGVYEGNRRGQLRVKYSF